MLVGIRAKHGAGTVTSSLPAVVRNVFKQIRSNDNNNDDNDRIQRCHSRFFTISWLRRKLFPTRMLKWPGSNRVQTTCNTSSAYDMQHVLHATWYEGARDSLEFKSHLF